MGMRTNELVWEVRRAKYVKACKSMPNVHFNDFIGME